MILYEKKFGLFVILFLRVGLLHPAVTKQSKKRFWLVYTKRFWLLALFCTSCFGFFVAIIVLRDEDTYSVWKMYSEFSTAIISFAFLGFSCRMQSRIKKAKHNVTKSLVKSIGNQLLRVNSAVSISLLFFFFRIYVLIYPQTQDIMLAFLLLPEFLVSVALLYTMWESGVYIDRLSMNPFFVLLFLFVCCFCLFCFCALSRVCFF